MGMVICPEHGRGGIVPAVSLDVCEAIRSGKAAEIGKIFVVAVDLHDGEKLLGTLDNHLSERLFKAHRLSPRYVIQSDEDEKALEAIFPPTQPVCARCFQEYVAKHAIEVVEP